MPGGPPCYLLQWQWIAPETPLVDACIASRARTLPSHVRTVVRPFGRSFVRLPRRPVRVPSSKRESASARAACGFRDATRTAGYRAGTIRAASAAEAVASGAVGAAAVAASWSLLRSRSRVRRKRRRRFSARESFTSGGRIGPRNDNGPSRRTREGPFDRDVALCYSGVPPEHCSPRPVTRPRALLRRSVRAQSVVTSVGCTHAADLSSVSGVPGSADGLSMEGPDRYEVFKSQLRSQRAAAGSPCSTGIRAIAVSTSDRMSALSVGARCPVRSQMIDFGDRAAS